MINKPKQNKSLPPKKYITGKEKLERLTLAIEKLKKEENESK